MPIPIPRKIFLDRADRVQRMPVPSDALARSAERLCRRGVEVIDLSRLSAGATGAGRRVDFAQEPDGWQRAGAADCERLSASVADWYGRRFGVRLDPKREITFAPNTIIALHLLATAFLDTGELALLPDPGAPFYRGAIVLCGNGVIPYHLLERNDYLPAFAGMEAALVGRTRLLVMGYPHSPTAATADLAVMTQAVAFARRHNILVAFDGAFSYATAGAFRPRTFLEAAGAKGVGVELAAIGPNFGIGDFPLSVVCGNREAVSAISFLLQAAQLRPSVQTVRAATELFANAESILKARVEYTEENRRLLVETAAELGWNPRSSPTAPFIWLQVPAVAGVEAFCRRILRRAGVLLTPGNTFGERGEGFARMVLPEDSKLARTVSERLKQHARLHQRRLPRQGTRRAAHRRDKNA